VHAQRHGAIVVLRLRQVEDQPEMAWGAVQQAHPNLALDLLTALQHRADQAETQAVYAYWQVAQEQLLDLLEVVALEQLHGDLIGVAEADGPQQLDVQLRVAGQPGTQANFIVDALFLQEGRQAREVQHA